ncbi:hypothetical protein C9374_001095 [Naegleria lovaniensis]|uniref:Uncharacterized protein n=1 Tax=Naegleria lovaniensis TaxID=51637 RepID=A0AA88GX19_NAELO|nr:uncharacterized protein C9374_001095 [Naegleria lovaniensis]KAG2387501.1 hypothetical protein C9374_001095 [Naegleria lovaniensis]
MNTSTTYTYVRPSDGLFTLILGKTVETITANNKIYYRFQDLRIKYDTVSKYSKNDDTIKGPKNLIYVCMEIVVEIILKEDRYRPLFFNYLTQQQLQQIHHNSQTTQQPLSQTTQQPSQNSVLHGSQDTTTRQQHKSSGTKKPQQEIDKQNKIDSLSQRSSKKPKVLTKRSRSTDHEISETTKKKKQNKKAREQEIDLYLKTLIQKYDKEKEDIAKANISKVNLVAASETRDVFIQHNSLRNNSNSFDAASRQHTKFFDLFSEISNLCHIKFSHLLYHHFKKNPEAIIALSQAISSSNIPEGKKNVYRQFKQMTLRPISLTKQLKVKDELCCSNKAWKEHIFSLGLKDILQADLKAIEGQVTNALVEYFGIDHKLRGFVMKIEAVIIAAVKSHLHNVYLRKQRQCPVHEELPDSLVVKMSMDGRKFDGLQTVVVTLSILNLTTFGTQERRNVFPIAMYIGDEEDILKYCEDFKEEVEKISKEGIDIVKKKADSSLSKENFNLKVTIIWVSDLKSLSFVSDLLENDMFCLRCCCLTSNSLNGTSKPRFLNHKFGIDSSKIYICILHADERITEHLVKWSLGSGEHETLILERVKKLPCFSPTFTFRSQAKQTSDTEEEPVLDYQDYKFMLTGGMVEAISHQYKNIFEDIISSELMQIWDLWITIRQWLKMTNEERAKKTEQDQREFYLQLTQWHVKLTQFRSSVGQLPYYMHIIVHHVKEFFDEIGSLVPISNEAVEGSHQHDHFITERATAKGKKKFFFEDIDSVYSEMEKIDYEEPEMSIDEFDRVFRYERHIPKQTEPREWNQLYRIFQLIVKKLRVLYLSFRSDEDTTFERIEERSGKKKEKWMSFKDMIINDRVLVDSNEETTTNLESTRTELEISQLDLNLELNFDQEQLFQEEQSDNEEQSDGEDQIEDEEMFNFDDGDEEMAESISDGIVDYDLLF